MVSPKEDFAALAGIARSYCGRIERGECNVAALNLTRAALALEVKVGSFFPTFELLWDCYHPWQLTADLHKKCKFMLNEILNIWRFFLI